MYMTRRLLKLYEIRDTLANAMGQIDAYNEEFNNGISMGTLNDAYNEVILEISDEKECIEQRDKDREIAAEALGKYFDSL